jgi:hypothetical protein
LWCCRSNWSLCLDQCARCWNTAWEVRSGILLFGTFSCWHGCYYKAILQSSKLRMDGVIQEFGKPSTSRIRNSFATSSG